MPSLSLAEVQSLIDYDPATGEMIWRRREGLVGKAAAWNTRYAGTAIRVIDNKGYICVQVYRKKYRGHRVVWLLHYGTWPSLDLDHINGIKHDNRISNLREATVAQNGYNVGLTSRNSSGVRGVFWHATARKWQAGIRAEGSDIYLGLFVHLSDAAKARRDAEAKYYGEFARAA